MKKISFSLALVLSGLFSANTFAQKGVVKFETGAVKLWSGYTRVSMKGVNDYFADEEKSRRKQWEQEEPMRKKNEKYNSDHGIIANGTIDFEGSEKIENALMVGADFLYYIY